MVEGETSISHSVDITYGYHSAGGFPLQPCVLAIGHNGGIHGSWERVAKIAVVTVVVVLEEDGGSSSRDRSYFCRHC